MGEPDVIGLLQTVYTPVELTAVSGRESEFHSNDLGEHIDPNARYDVSLQVQGGRRPDAYGVVDGSAIEDLIAQTENLVRAELREIGDFE